MEHHVFCVWYWPRGFVCPHDGERKEWSSMLVNASMCMQAAWTKSWIEININTILWSKLNNKAWMFHPSHLWCLLWELFFFFVFSMCRYCLSVCLAYLHLMLYRYIPPLIRNKSSLKYLESPMVLWFNRLQSWLDQSKGSEGKQFVETGRKRRMRSWVRWFSFYFTNLYVDSRLYLCFPWKIVYMFFCVSDDV